MFALTSFQFVSRRGDRLFEWPWWPCIHRSRGVGFVIAPRSGYPETDRKGENMKIKMTGRFIWFKHPHVDIRRFFY